MARRRGLPGAASGRHLATIATAILLGLAPPAAARAVLVSAAASLTNAVGEAAAAFELRHPDVAVTCNFAGSGVLLRQIERGAPVDVFLSADRETMDQAQRAGLIRAETRTPFAANSLVLVVHPTAVPGGVPPGDGPALESGLWAIGNPKFVPAGRYARGALLRDGLWDGLEGRLVLGNSVRQVLDYVARSEVAGGVVYATDAAAAATRVVVAGSLWPTDPIVYPGAVTRASAEPGAAGEFLRFLGGAEGRAVLARHGFTPPPETAASSHAEPWTSR